jgi:hypothetical protein
VKSIKQRRYRGSGSKHICSNSTGELKRATPATRRALQATVASAGPMPSTNVAIRQSPIRRWNVVQLVAVWAEGDACPGHTLGFRCRRVSSAGTPLRVEHKNAQRKARGASRRTSAAILHRSAGAVGSAFRSVERYRWAPEPAAPLASAAAACWMQVMVAWRMETQQDPGGPQIAARVAQQGRHPRAAVVQ